MKFQIGNYTITIEKKALDDSTLPKDVQEALQVLAKHGYTSPPSPKKIEGAKKAREALQAKTKEKIQNAINLLKMEGKEITPYRVAKEAGVSYNTAKKYLSGGNADKD